MSAEPLTENQLNEAIQAYHEANGDKSAAARLLGIARTTYYHRFDEAERRGFVGEPDLEFERDELPDEIAPVQELIDRRKKEWDRVNTAYNARNLIPVRIKVDGPVGIVHFGDPHIDDRGTNIGLLETHLEVVKNTPALFGANVGDLHNNWVGRLSHLYEEQTTMAVEAWRLVEWMIGYIDWLYLIKGNHDKWVGNGDPLDWLRKNTMGVTESWGARLDLQFPNSKEVRINVRHDFRGHSMWNPGHGLMKAIHMGWRDHVLTAGHKHISAYGILKCPSTGLISHAIRVAGYKIHDSFGTKQLGLPNQNISPAFTTIIDPQYEDNDPRLITTLFDVEEAADYLTWKRNH